MWYGRPRPAPDPFGSGGRSQERSLVPREVSTPPHATLKPVSATHLTINSVKKPALWPDSLEGEVEFVLELPTSEGIILVAEKSTGGLCGFAKVGVRKFAEECSDSPVAYLEGIWIDGNARREGVGSALVREAEGWACSRGFTELA